MTWRVKMEGKTRNKFFTVFIAVILGLTVCSTAGAAIHTVGLSEGGTYGTIAEAILNAADEDTIQILSPVHTEEGIVVDKNLTITGASPDNTIVQAHGSRDTATDRVFEIASNATVVIENMTIQNGRAPDGADGSNPGDPGIAGENGGGVLNNGNLTLRNCRIIDNIAGNGGDGLAGADGQKGADGQNGTAGLESLGGGCNPAFGMQCCTDRPAPNGCHGTAGGDGADGAVGQNGGDGGDGGNGGGVYNKGNLTIDNCEINNNEAGDGGASAAAGNGGAGGNGGDGGGGGKADFFSAGEGGTGGDAGDGANGANGANGGKAGDGGSGGGIYSDNAGGAKLLLTGSNEIISNQFGSEGSNASASAGAAGAAGAAGLAGPGGMNGVNNTTDSYAPAGAAGTAGTAGTAGAAGEAGVEGTIPDFANVPTVIDTVDPGTDDDDLTTAVSGGNVTDTGGGALIIARGVCWNTATEPNVVYHTCTEDDTGNTGPGEFTSRMTGLSLDTTYYVRAYAINSQGPAYGPEETYRTEVQAPTLTTGVPASVTIRTALCTSSVDLTGGADITQRGICWNDSPLPDIVNNYTGMTDNNTNEFPGTYDSTISGLTPDTSYYVRAYATNAEGKTGYGPEQSFRTLVLSEPTVDTLSAVTDTVLPQRAATLEGEVTANGNAEIVARGAVWSTLPSPLITDPDAGRTNDNTNALTGTFTSAITGLTPGTDYYVRAYATNNENLTGYGNDILVQTDDIANPDVSTAPVTPVYQRVATSGGTVNMTGGEDIIARGVCWSTDPNPDINDTCTTDDTANSGINTVPYVSSVEGLIHSTTYYLRAYATNSADMTGYGAQEPFTTLAADKPAVSTSTEAPNPLLSTSATLGGNVLSDGGADLESVGICWNLSQFEDTANKNDLEGCSTDAAAVTGPFVSNLKDLSYETKYYARAYATNGLGTTFGNIVDFTTEPANKAVVTYADGQITIITEINAQSASFIAQVDDDGDAPVTKRGFVWNDSGLPIVESGADLYTDNGTGLGEFIGSASTGLEPGKPYYVRAYATNAVGTSYGKQEQFTLKAAPTVTTKDPVAIVTSTSATVGGNVVSDGGDTVTERGICWSKSQSHTDDTCISDTSSGEGEFEVQITDLAPLTAYYVRAYATNSMGREYGASISFTTAKQVDPGDVDGDDDVDLQDAILALKVLAGLNPPGVYVGADVNGDGKIGIEDVIFILRAVMGA